MNHNLQVWKPIIIVNGKAIIFNEFCYYRDPEYKYLTPLIIHYDEQEDCYYYLKAREAISSNDSLKRIYNIGSATFKGEVYIKGTHINNTLLEKDSLIDCSQIFKIEASYLESLVDTNHILNQTSNILAQEHINKIIDGLKWCIMQKPLYLSIIEVFKGKNDLPEAESLYLCDKKWAHANELSHGDYYFIKKDKSPSDFKLTADKINNSLKIARIFITKFFPQELDKFNSIKGK